MALIERIRNQLWRQAATALLKSRRANRGLKLSEARTAVLYGLYESPEQFRIFNEFAADLERNGLKVYRFLYCPTEGNLSKASKAAGSVPPSATGTDGNAGAGLPVTDEAQRLFVITPQDLAFNRCPKAAFRQKLAGATENSFHLLLDTSERFHHVDAYMAGLLPARFKIGFAKDLPLKQSPYDLTLKPAEGKSLRERLDLLLLYLNNF